MGTRERSFATLANVSLEELVSADHFYRQFLQARTGRCWEYFSGKMQNCASPV